MRKFFIIIGVVIGCSLWAVELVAPDYVEQGQILQIAVKNLLLEDITVSLISTEGKAVCRAKGFLWVSPKGQKVNVALLGISPQFEQGHYNIVLQAMNGGTLWEMEKAVTIREHQYSEKSIVLSDSMNRLLSTNEERKKREARILWSVLNNANLEALHHFGMFISPVKDGMITSDYGERRRYKKPTGAEISSVHFGRDLWKEQGTPILATGRGRVVLATERFLTGNTVILEHLPGVYTLYYHLDAIDVVLGEIVSQGAVIGTLGKTGFVTGEHLHWEMRVGGVPVDASLFLQQGLLDTKALISMIN